jgi:hypothetical protein
MIMSIPKPLWRTFLLVLCILAVPGGAAMAGEEKECLRTFRTAEPLLRVWHDAFAAYGDVDGDGTPDIVIDGFDRFVALNRGNGVFDTTRHRQGGGRRTNDLFYVFDVDGDGFGDLVNPGTAHSPGDIRLGNGDGTFGEPVRSDIATPIFALDTKGTHVALAIISDWAMAGIRISNGDGTFTDGGILPFHLPVDREWVTAGDIDGDGLVDLVIGNRKDSILGIAWNRGNLKFEVTTHVVQSRQDHFGTADLDGNGADEIIALRNGNLVIGSWKGGAVSFRIIAIEGLAESGSNRLVGAADLDGDGKKDLVFAARNGVLVLWGSDDDPYRQFSMFDIPDYGMSALVDLDGNGVPEVVPTAFAGVDLHVIWGASGSRELGAGRTDVRFHQGHPTSIVTADLNGDGALDLIRSLRYVEATSVGHMYFPPVPWGADVWLGDGKGGFTRSAEYRMRGPIPGGIGSVHVVDLDGDSHPDLVISNDTAQGKEGSVTEILLGRGDGTFVPTGSVLEGVTPVGAGAVMSDGSSALIVRKGDALWTARVDASGELVLEPMYELDGLPWYVTVSVFDLDGDGIDEVVVHGMYYYYVDHLLKLVDGEWRLMQEFDTSSNRADILDLDGDGIVDLVLSDNRSGVYRGTGDGFELSHFIDRPYYSVAQQKTALLVDVDGDGRKDIVAVGGTSFTIVLEIHLNDGKGNFVLHEIIQVSGHDTYTKKEFVLADFDGDGRVDVMTFLGTFLRSQCAPPVRLRAVATPAVVQEGEEAELLVMIARVNGSISVTRDGAQVCPPHTINEYEDFGTFSCRTGPLYGGRHVFQVRFENAFSSMQTEVEVTVPTPSPRRRAVRR